MSKRFKLCIIVVWFGKWPEWADLFFRSCATNKSIDFLVFTDCELRDSMLSENIQVERLELSKLFERFSVAIRLPQVIYHKPYKLCDFKPAYGVAFRDYLSSYTHWGSSDLDLIFGNLEHFIDNSADIFSTHRGFISGHFFYVRNIPLINNSFKLIRGWRPAMISNKHYGLDEGAWSNIFMPKSTKAKVMSATLRLFGAKYNIVDEELFTTPHNGIPWSDGTCEYPDHWIYEDGRLTAVQKGTVLEVPYIHFMNWKPGSKYLSKTYEKPLWDGVDLTGCQIISREKRIKIDATGFSLI
jgi:hypothetical protein